MNSKDTRPGGAADLRKRAEELIRAKEAALPENLAGLSPEAMRRELHELRVHQLELEMQNEALRETQAKLDAVRARYFDLYDLAPVGYCTISEHGLILEANLTAATMLGVARSTLTGQRFSRFILRDDQDSYYLRRKQLFETGEPQAMELRLVKHDGTAFWARLDAIVVQDAEGTPECRVVLRDITVRKQAEQELLESMEHFRAMVDDQMELISRFSADGTFLFVNQGFCTFFGKSREELTGTIWAPVVFAEDLPLVQEQMARLSPGNPLVMIENRNRNADGEVRWMQFSNRAFFDETGALREIQSVGRDITERIQAEQALRESEGRYLATLTAVNDGLWDWHVPSGKAYFSPLYYALLGYEDNAFPASYATWKPLIHPEDLDRVEPVLRRSIESGQGFSVDLRMRTKDGAWKWVATRGNAIEHDAAGNALRMVGTLSDITERRELEARLRESELHFRTLANSGQALVWTSGLDKLCDYFNEPWLAFTGRALEQELGNGWAEGVHPDDFEGCLEIYVTAFERRESFSMEYRLRHASGEYRWIVDQGTPRHDSQGEFLGYIGHCLDITERKRTEQALLAARDAAEAASRAKGEFLANMSHELRTPMNGVLGMLQLLLMEELSSGQQNYVRKAFEAANRLLSLLNDILDFSRIEAGALTFRQEPYRLADILAATADVFGHICARKGLSLRFEPDPGLPAVLVGDEARLRQIVFNLVGNAVKFTRKGGVRIAAWRQDQAGEKPGRLVIAVADTGVGIPQDKLDSVFDRFSQADGSYTRQFEGAGLGLAIVRRIVEGLGGTLCIDSEPGCGTTMVLSLPAPTAQNGVLPAQAGASTALPEESVALRILLAEDELIGQLGARMMLERMGHSVVAVGDGRAAVESALGGGFDCVLMDIQMPEMDGLEATRIIRSRSLPGKGQLPIVAMTAYALSGDREKFLAAGMDEYIAKPFQQEELRSLLQAVARTLGQGVRP